MLFTLLPALIVIPQPDLGTGLVYVVVAFMMLVFAGTPVEASSRGSSRRSLAVVAFVLVGAPALGVHVLKPYQVQRLTGFVNPSRDPAQPDLQHPAVGDRDRLRTEDGPGRRARHADEPATTCPSIRLTSSSRPSARPTGSSGARSSYRCTRC